MRTATLAAAGLVACGHSAKPTSPADEAAASSPSGYTAADYDIDSGGIDLGGARVWSNGVYHAEIDGRTRTVVHAGFELESQGSRTLRLPGDQIALDSVTVDDELLKGLAPARVDSAPPVAPGGLAEVQAYFALPEGVHPRDIEAFRLRWQLCSGELTYRQSTPFLRKEPPRGAYVADYYYSPFYDPFFHDPFVYGGRVVVHHYPFHHHHVL